MSEAPAARAALREASQRWPGRSTASDGILPSAAHRKQNPTSDHDHGNAFDLTHDPAAGVDCARLAAWLVDRCRSGAERRATYVIHDGRIASAARGWTWRRYEGKNPHRSHMHVSVRSAHRGDTRPWWAGYGSTPAPAPQESNDMAKLDNDDLAAIDKIVARHTRTVLGNPTGPDADPTHLSLADLNRRLVALEAKLDER